ncbi:MAG: hypothetical protein D6690_00360 [Nitrospirae bacterium]|nr:MAG: hypothetical protein D6690_00360 [Nitrospirota bacterium]
MTILIGTNVLRNTNGIVLAHGQEQLRIECQPDGPPLLTMPLCMPTGREVGKLERNVWISNEGDRFVLTQEGRSVVLTDTMLKNVVIEVVQDDHDQVRVPQAKFYTTKGVLSEATSEWWRVGNKMELKGVDMDLEGGAIELPD